MSPEVLLGAKAWSVDWLDESSSVSFTHFHHKKKKQILLFLEPFQDILGKKLQKLRALLYCLLQLDMHMNLNWERWWYQKSCLEELKLSPVVWYHIWQMHKICNSSPQALHHLNTLPILMSFTLDFKNYTYATKMWSLLVQKYAELLKFCSAYASIMEEKSQA